MIRTFDVPNDDRFQIVGEHAPGSAIVHPPHYLDIEYSDELVVIQITCNDTQKKPLFAAVADNLTRSPGLRREDLVVNLVEVKKENW